jgi:hypothetical protein
VIGSDVLEDELNDRMSVFSHGNSPNPLHWKKTNEQFMSDIKKPSAIQTTQDSPQRTQKLTPQFNKTFHTPSLLNQNNNHYQIQTLQAQIFTLTQVISPFFFSFFLFI